MGWLMEMGTNYHSIKFVGWRWLRRQRIICPDGLGKICDYLKNMCSYLGIEDADVTFLCNTVVFDGEELHASYYQSLLSQVRDMVDAL